MIKALNDLNELEGRMHFNRTSRRMFRQLGRLVGGYKGFILSHINWIIFRPIAKKLFDREPVFDALVRNTTVLTHIKNPEGPVNQIPESITAYLDCRLLPGTNRRRFFREMQKNIFKPRFTFTILDEGPKSKESGYRTPFYKALDKSLREVYNDAPVIPVLFHAGSDNNYFRQMGIPTYGITPIAMSRDQLNSIHGSNEKITLQNLRQGTELYYRFIQKLAKTKKLPQPAYLISDAEDLD
jgi:carboxypeptidase PM20D1